MCWKWVGKEARIGLGLAKPWTMASHCSMTRIGWRKHYQFRSYATAMHGPIPCHWREERLQQTVQYSRVQPLWNNEPRELCDENCLTRLWQDCDKTVMLVWQVCDRHAVAVCLCAWWRAVRRQTRTKRDRELKRSDNYRKGRKVASIGTGLLHSVGWCVCCCIYCSASHWLTQPGQEKDTKLVRHQ